MCPVTQGESRRQEIVAAFRGPIVAGADAALSQADIDALIQRAVATYCHGQKRPIGSPTELELRAYAREIIDDADRRGCITIGTGVTAFIIFAFAWCACLMLTHQLTWRGMKGVMAAIDDLLCALWHEARAITEFPSTRGRS